MVDPKATVYLDNIALTPRVNKEIDSFEYHLSIDNIYPEAVLRLSDFGGNILSKFENIAIGTPVKLKVSEYSSKVSEDTVTFENLQIAAIAENISNNETGTGIIEILCKHPWHFHQDFSNHLYSSMPNSEVIKHTLELKGKGFSFNLDPKNISSSDEDGSIPRYKCCEGDRDFILNKVLPYTIIEGNPALFWISESNSPFLKSTEELFTQKPVGIAASQTPNITNSKSFKAFAKKANTKNLFLFSKALLKIGDENISIFTENLSSLAIVDLNERVPNIGPAVVKGTVENTIKINKNTPNMIGATLPILQNLVEKNMSTKPCFFRNLKDHMSLLTNETLPFTDIFTLELSGSFCGETAKVGSILTIYFPTIRKLANSNNMELHWLTGPWLVKEVFHSFSSKNNYNISSKIILCRPSFLFETSVTKINTTKFYKV